MSKREEYITIANALSDETKVLFARGADVIRQVVEYDDVRYGLVANELIAIAELGTLLKVLPLLAGEKTEVNDEQPNNNN